MRVTVIPERPYAPRRLAGFSLVEIVVTIVILAIALIGVSAMVRLGSEQSADVMQQTRAIALAQAYLDEIMGRRYDENSSATGLFPCFGAGAPRPCSSTLGPDTGETDDPDSREYFDDVDDYNGWVEGDGEGAGRPIRDAEGNTRSGYDNFHIAIEVAYAGTAAPWSEADQTHAKLIKVTVTLRNQNVGWVFSAYKGNY
jgi:MSHA pilin protein MshD